MDRLLISAAHKSSGKTTVALGLCAALAAAGRQVQPFKKGPDYIDPMWLGRAAGRACINLDPFVQDDPTLAGQFTLALDGCDIALVEGNKGLYDGLALDGSNSNAALARRLGLPVLLVLDARGMTRGIAPLILGYQAFEPAIRIGGVILNRLGGSRHEAKLRAVIEHYTDVTVLGALAEDPALAMSERHLGLVPCAEVDDALARIRSIAARVAAGVDLPGIQSLAATAGPWSRTPASRPAPGKVGQPVRIAVARDRAFGFYYADDLAALQAAGAELVGLDTLADRRLPPVDGLLIGGGFPETCLEALEANGSLRAELRAALASGLPAYAECGGLMYLSRSIRWNGRTARMVGAIPADTVMHARPVGRGYVELAETDAMPWKPAGGLVRAHEFHYSSLENLGQDARFAYRVTRGHGIDGVADGLVVGNLLASYSHLRSSGGTDWPRRFVDFVREVAWKPAGRAETAAHRAPNTPIEPVAGPAGDSAARLSVARAARPAPVPAPPRAPRLRTPPLRRAN